jgi:phosphatidyl-myo-inositol dimannoside synthase
LKGRQIDVVESGSGHGLLGLFPSFTEPGGIQTSGKVAWEGILEGLAPGSRGALGQDRHAYLFSYGKKARARHHGAGEKDADSWHTVRAGSRLEAALAALRLRWPVRLVLVWHIGLLRLLPFFRVGDARVAVVLHGIEAWRPLDWLTRALMRRIGLFLSDSDHTWDRFVGANPRCARIPHQTVYLGILSPVVASVAAPGHPPAVLMLSRLLRSEDYKGHREMIDAWPRVLDRMHDAELWIAGDGDLLGELERQAAIRGLARRIRFWGWVSEARKQELLAHCRCLALPSRNEGFGIVYVEAMRQGRPCLVSTLDAGLEIVNPPEAGLAVDLREPVALDDAICRLLRPGPEWETWSQQARKRYEANFTAEHFRGRLLAALTPLL